MSAQSDAYYVTVLHGIGAPIDDANMFTCHAWQHMEGGSARYNAWNTTQPWPHSTDYNSVGVKNYASAYDGEQATIKTLLNGHYPDIIAGFKASDPQATADAIDKSPWGTSGVGAYVHDHWHGGSHDVALSDADVERIADRTVAKLLAHKEDAPTGSGDPGKWSMLKLWRATYNVVHPRP